MRKRAAAAPPTTTSNRAFLRRSTRPNYSRGRTSLGLVDLFSGCGALTLGFAEAARRLGLVTRIPLAVDSDATACSVYRDNFPEATVRNLRVEELFGGSLGSQATDDEEALLITDVDLIVSGPPCQGHSSLNNHTRSSDVRNALYSRVVRAAEVLRPEFVVIENVPGVERDRRAVVPAAVTRLMRMDYRVAGRTISLDQIGVPQRRRRHVLLASASLDPASILENLNDKESRATVDWAIRDLETTLSNDTYDRPGALSLENQKRIEWLFEHRAYDLPNRLRPPCHRDRRHSYRSMYGRLKWDQPAQTITTGFSSPGQGRYVHPSRARTLTPHEAARLQTIPDFFRFDAAASRAARARMIGNAVPPLLGINLGLLLLPSLIRTGTDVTPVVAKVAA